MFRKMVPPDKRITMLFSATLDTRVRHLAWRHMNRPVNIEIDPENVTVDEVEQVLYHVAKSRKMSLLLGILKKEAPQNALIFTNTKRAAVEVAERLRLNGYSCRFIIGDLPQRKRLQVIDGLKSGKYPFLAATDVAARGLHVEDLDMVVNYDLPEDREGYVHRIGRTARAGKRGKAVALVCEEYVYGLEGIESFTGEKIPVGRIEESMFEPDKSDGVPLNLHRYRPSGRQFKDRRKRSGYGRQRPGKRAHSSGSGSPGSAGKSHRPRGSHSRRPNNKPKPVKT
jgi:ATP-dependent RNA helicase RhlB